MIDTTFYTKIVEWSEEDGCFVGTCPELLHGGCHGEDEATVFDQLSAAVNDALELYRQDGNPLPAPTNKTADKSETSPPPS
jgi:predicted RNase H-like HicB family nuclease